MVAILVELDKVISLVAQAIFNNILACEKTSREHTSEHW